MKKVVLKRGREFSVAGRGHPWVFSGAVGDTDAGAEMVEVFSSDGERLGVGFHSPSSQIRIRMMPERPVAELVAESVGRRAALYRDGDVTAIRLVNAESDGLPGVVADCYAGWVVCQFTSAGAEYFKSEIAAALAKYAPFCRGVAERSDVEVRAKEGLCVGEAGTAFSVLAGDEPPELVEIRENAVRFLVDVRRGHKTGFYLDQRDARAAVASFSSDRNVLNCFSYTGGFGIAASKAGAKSVVQVDSSSAALELAERNAGLNSCGAMEFVEADVFKYLRKCRDCGRKFDLIVLDPPKFADSKSHLDRAARGYKDINLLAMKLLSPGGVLATFSCSGAVTQGVFDRILAEAAFDAGRDFAVAARTMQAPDHPSTLFFPEAFYLKGVVLKALDGGMPS